MKTQKKPEAAAVLLRELENLQQVLDGIAESHSAPLKDIPVLEPLDDIPLLNEVLDEALDDEPALKAVSKTPESKPAPVQTAATAEPARKIENPFLPQSVLDRLNHEREAAQHSAEEAHRTMLRITEQKHQSARSALSGLGKELSREQKDAIIDQLVNEMLPQIADRLREKLRLMLNR